MELIILLWIGFMATAFVIARKNHQKTEEKMKRLGEGVKKMFETFNSLPPEIQEEFYNVIDENQKKRIARINQSILEGKEIRVHKLKPRFRQAIQELYQWFMKKNLETNFKIYSALKEEHQEAIKMQLKPRSRKLFDKVYELYNVAGAVPYSNMKKILQYGFLATFLTNMEDFRNSFMDLSRQTHDLLNATMSASLDTQMLNMDEMNTFNAFENMQNTMQENFHSLLDDQFHQFSLDEAWKIVTPFDHGGYVMGPGFNPSDTMAHEAQMEMTQQMDMMNEMMMNQMMLDMTQQMDMMNNMMHQMDLMNEMNNMMDMNMMNDMNHMNQMNDMHNNNFHHGM